MIVGAHSIVYSTEPDADRAFLRDVLELTHVDVGHEPRHARPAPMAASKPNP